MPAFPHSGFAARPEGARAAGGAASVALLALLLAGCPTSFELVVQGDARPPRDAAPPDQGEPFECGAGPSAPLPAPEDDGNVNYVGDGSRESCTAAALDRALEGGGYIRFRCGTGLAEVTTTRPFAVTEDGTVVDGEGRITITGGSTSRIFDVAGSATLAVVRNISLSRGSADAGGALRVASGARLWLDQVVFTSNTATGATAPGTPPSVGGGAVHVLPGGELVSVGTNFLNNGADFGGAIWNQGRVGVHTNRFRSNLAVAGVRSGGAIAVSGGQLVLCDSELEDNRAGQGGGLFVEAATLKVVGTAFIANPAIGGDPRLGSVGGAIVLRDSDVIVEQCTFDGNLSSQGGGAIEAAGGVSRWENVTFVDNNASGGAGGAILFRAGRHEVVHATVVDNVARDDGSAFAGDAEVTLVNSLVAGDEPACAQTYGGSAVIQTGATPCVPGATVVADLGLGATRSTCGRLDVFTPPASSPALGAGEASSCAVVDQCGRERGAGACDLGAIEQ